MTVPEGPDPSTTRNMLSDNDIGEPHALPCVFRLRQALQECTSYRDVSGAICASCFGDPFDAERTRSGGVQQAPWRYCEGSIRWVRPTIVLTLADPIRSNRNGARSEIHGVTGRCVVSAPCVHRHATPAATPSRSRHTRSLVYEQCVHRDERLAGGASAPRRSRRQCRSAGYPPAC